MPVVLIPTPLRPHTGGLDRVAVTGSTVGECFDDLCRQHPGLRDRILEGAELRRFVNVYVNDEDIRYMDDLATAVEDRGEISIIPAIAGG